MKEIKFREGDIWNTHAVYLKAVLEERYQALFDDIGEFLLKHTDFKRSRKNIEKIIVRPEVIILLKENKRR